MRVSLSASRLTRVMQYCSRGLAVAFRKLGCDVDFSIEQSDLEGVNWVIRSRTMRDHNPHLIVHINYLNNSFLHPDVFNVVWFQDPMPSVLAGEPLPWRERDLVFSITRELDQGLQKTGAKEIFRQLICIDPGIFHVKPAITRKPKVVIASSSYVNFLPQFVETRPNELKKVMAATEEVMLSGVAITKETLRDLADQNRFPFESLFWRVFPYLVRERSVEWLCQNSDLIDVEIYGRHWDQNEIVRPFFKGEVTHGDDLANLYNSAQYALVPQGFWIQSQRLAEVAACGCIPLLYDCREMAELPHWDEECLFYRTPEELRACIGRQPAGDIQAIAYDMTYEKFARRVLDLIDQRADWQ